MLLLFETPAGYSLFKVKDENKLKDIDVRSSSLSRFFPFLFVCVSRPPPIGERAINDHVFVVILSLSLSKSSCPIDTRDETTTIVSLYRTSRTDHESMVVSGKETYQRARARLVGISCAS